MNRVLVAHPPPRPLRHFTSFWRPVMTKAFAIDPRRIPGHIPVRRAEELVKASFGDEPPADPAADKKYHDGGRDVRGRFTRGNAGGPGNPCARQSAKLRQLFVDSATPEEFAHVKKRLL